MRSLPSPALAPLLAAVPPASQQRLIVMGWSIENVSHFGSLESSPRRRLHDPERALRRAVGGPQQVSLVDLELDPERWHGRFLTTAGPLTWHPASQHRPGGYAYLGRLWVDTTVIALSDPGVRLVPASGRVRILGVLLADRGVRAHHHATHKAPGGYGHSGLFIAQLAAVAIVSEAPEAPEPHA